MYTFIMSSQYNNTINGSEIRAAINTPPLAFSQIRPCEFYDFVVIIQIKDHAYYCLLLLYRISCMKVMTSKITGS